MSDTPMYQAVPITSNKENEMQLEFMADPGHAWLKVPITTIKELGIADKISTYSYVNGEFAYLEEDCDASVLINALSDIGIEFGIKETFTDGYSPIRNYQSFRAGLVA